MGFTDSLSFILASIFIKFDLNLVHIKIQVKKKGGVLGKIGDRPRKEWPENTERLMSLLSGPKEDLTGYIPDFGFELYDLHRFADDQIKGTIVSRVVLLLLKHIRDPDLRQKLPDIFALMQTLMEKETGLQWLEVVVRYLASAREKEDLSWEQIKEIAEQAISKETGGYVMTLAEKLRNEGKLEGKLEGLVECEQKGEAKGLRNAIELGITLKFPGGTLKL